MGGIERTIVEKDDGTPGSPPHHNFQEWLADRWGDEHTSLERASHDLAGKSWLDRGAPQDGGTSQPLDQVRAENLMYKAYELGDEDALAEVIRLWDIPTEP